MLKRSPIAPDVAYIGIDPGTSGVIAVINDTDLSLFAIPVRDTTRLRLDVPALCSLAHSLFATLGAGRVCVEDVWVTKGGNPSAETELVYMAGACAAAFAAAGFDVLPPVPPKTWKAAFGCAGSGLVEANAAKRRQILKTRAREAAARVFPAHATFFERVKDADRAEAALIAEYTRRTDGA